MPNYFDRKILLEIGDLAITDLRVNFSIEKSLVGYPNLANIKVYNLSEHSRNQIETQFKDISFSAGYNVPVSLFKGQVINVVHQKFGVDWITEIFSGDATKQLSESTINKTLGAGATTEQIYAELVGGLDGITQGITEGLKNCVTGKKSLLRAVQLSGSIKQWLDAIAEECGFDYSVNDGVIETTEVDKPLNDVAPIIINQGSGMIGSPERTEIGVIVRTLMNPNLKLARRIQIKAISQAINIGNLFFRKIPPVKNEGIYRIDKLTHIGDTHDNTWETKIQARVF